MITHMFYATLESWAAQSKEIIGIAIPRSSPVIGLKAKKKKSRSTSSGRQESVVYQTELDITFLFLVKEKCSKSSRPNFLPERRASESLFVVIAHIPVRKFDFISLGISLPCFYICTHLQWAEKLIISCCSSDEREDRQAISVAGIRSGSPPVLYWFKRSGAELSNLLSCCSIVEENKGYCVAESQNSYFHLQTSNFHEPLSAQQNRNLICYFCRWSLVMRKRSPCK